MGNNDEERRGLLSNQPSAPVSSYQDYQEPPPYEQTNLTYPSYPYPQPPPTNLPTFNSNYQSIPVIQTQVILVGGCPACRVGVLEDDYTCCGICCAVLFFPLGVLCCLATKQKRCCNCGAVYG